MSVSSSREAAAQLAPSGTLRAAINFGNPVLAGKDATTGGPRGVSVDLARELAKRIGVPLEVVTFSAAGKVVEAIGTWDVAFLAIDPARADDMDFTAPYVVVEGAYLVPQDSAIRSNDDVDRAGVRVVVGAGSAYDLYLTRELKRARIVRAPTSPMVVDTTGLPIARDKTFLFADYEGLRQDLGVTLTNTVPSAAARAGRLVAGPITVDPRVVPYPGATGDAVLRMLQEGDPTGGVWRPGETDVSIRPGWFWHEAENARVKKTQQLVNLYYQSVGRGATLLLNVPLRFRLLSLLRRLGLYHSSLLSALTSSLFELF